MIKEIVDSKYNIRNLLNDNFVEGVNICLNY